MSGRRAYVSRVEFAGCSFLLHLPPSLPRTSFTSHFMSSSPRVQYLSTFMPQFAACNLKSFCFLHCYPKLASSLPRCPTLGARRWGPGCICKFVRELVYTRAPWASAKRST
ncbi:Protein of unknown function [Pyronema omphalodes CBS 100304]|uniref:Uncharacterized protein n=1 Tax=Pyronema omphalodes (strain CBS 100304) TaxID=1076935 RepID=U4KZ72_PYROM|nr:Protein of unknown function [Pyronema omphalodes CBS 100304]